MKTSLPYGAFHSLYNQFGNSIFKIFSFYYYSHHDRSSSITRVHTTTWDYFSRSLADRFIRSTEVVKEAIMTDINEVQEFRSSSNGAVGTSFITMRRLFKILQQCFNYLNVCFDIISVFVTAVDLADKNLQLMTDLRYSANDEVSLEGKFNILFDGYRKMLDQSFCKSNDLADMLRFLPGVVVQRSLSLQGMADLYRIKPEFLERLIKSNIKPLKLALDHPSDPYVLDDYLSGLLQDRDRSQRYYCDPELQHTSICRQILSLLNQSNVFDLQS